MDKPSWAPIVLSGAVPRETSDLLATLVMGIVAIETIFATTGPLVSSRLILSVLIIPPTCALASVSTTTRRTREELALFAYGGSGSQIALRYFLRGAICSLIAFSPIITGWALSQISVLLLTTTVLTILFAGGLSYSLPSLHRIHSSSFVENYKS